MGCAGLDIISIGEIGTVAGASVTGCGNRLAGGTGVGANIGVACAAAPYGFLGLSTNYINRRIGEAVEHADTIRNRST